MSVSRRLRSRAPHPSRLQRFRFLTGVERLEDRSMLAAFVPGNFAVYRVGDGTQTLASSGNSVFIDEYTPSGDRVQSVSMAADTVNAGNENTLIAHGTLTTEGMLTRASDGQSLAVPGYTVAVGALMNASSRRVVGLVGVDANVDLSTTGLFNQNGNFRGAFQNGDRIYTSGAAGGVVIVTKGTTSGSTLITDSPPQTRSIAVFAGQLYVSHASGSLSLRIGSVGSGVPTTSGQTTTSLPGFPSTSLPYQFFFADLSSNVAGVDTLYVADDTANGGEIQKFSLVGGNWTAKGAISATAVRGLTARINGSSVTLYAATGSGAVAGGGSLYTFTDTTGYNVTVSGTATTIASAGAKTAFRGVALVPDDGLAAITGLSGSAEYSTGEEPILLSDSATFSDQSNFKGGSLTVSYLSGGMGDDTLSIADGNNIVADSGSVFFNGTQIGTYPTSGAGSGQSGHSLTVTFNAVLSETSVSAAAVEALIRRIAFGTSASAAGGDRRVQFQVQQNDGQTTTAVKTVQVTRSNSPPTANSDSVSADEDQAKEITLTADDVDGDNLAFVVTGGPSHGTLSGTAPNLTYTPDAHYHGDDSFAFKVNDGTVDSNEATISITVVFINDAPAADDAAVATDEDHPLAITLTGSDIDGDSLAFVVTNSPEHGTLSGTAPNLTYTPHSNFHGSDTFTFKVNDGTVDSGEATIDITVNAIDDLPTAESAEVETPEDTATDVTLVGNDVDGDELTYIITSDPERGTLSGTAPNLVYTPDSNYHGSGSFTFMVNDGTSNSTEATISVTISHVNDPPLAVAGELSTSEDTPTNGTLAGTDIDGDALTYAIVSDPTHGVLTSFDPSTGEYTYEPAADFNGPDSFIFKVNDGTADSAEAAVIITIASVNDAPVLTPAHPMLPAIDEDSIDPAGQLVSELLGSSVSDADPGTESGIAVHGVSANVRIEYSLDNGDNWLSIPTTVSKSSAVVVPATALVRMIPANDFHGLAKFYFRAWDGSDGLAAGAEVNLFGKLGEDQPYSLAFDDARVVVEPVNDAPVLAPAAPLLKSINQGVASPAGTSVWSLLGSSVSDVDARALRGIAVTFAGGPSNGTWQFKLANGTWTSIGVASHAAARLIPGTALVRFVPNPSFHGQVKLYFRAWDQTQGTAGGTLNVTKHTGGTTSVSRGYDNATLTVRMAPVLRQSDTAPIGYLRNSRPGVNFMLGAQLGERTSLTDHDSPSFGGGLLHVRTAAGRRTGDRLGVSWNFSISGTKVFFQTTQIGSVVSAGRDGAPLRISFNSNASQDLVRRLINSLRFRTEGGVAGTRTLEVSVADDGGAVSNKLLRTIKVS